VAATITVKKTGNLEFLVRVSEPASVSIHRVTVKKADYDRLTAGKIEPEELLRNSFKFLLEREPKESILSRFDLSVICRYFPEYENEMKRGLQ
jgi:hypothetical protein